MLHNQDSISAANGKDLSASLLGWLQALSNDETLRKMARDGRHDIRMTAIVLVTSFGRWGHNCRPKMETVAQIMGVEEKTIRRDCAELVSLGWLTAEKRTGKTTVYGIADPGHSTPVPEPTPDIHDVRAPRTFMISDDTSKNSSEIKAAPPGAADTGTKNPGHQTGIGCGTCMQEDAWNYCHCEPEDQKLWCLECKTRLALFHCWECNPTPDTDVSGDTGTAARSAGAPRSAGSSKEGSEEKGQEPVFPSVQAVDATPSEPMISSTSEKMICNICSVPTGFYRWQSGAGYRYLCKNCFDTQKKQVFASAGW